MRGTRKGWLSQEKQPRRDGAFALSERTCWVHCRDETDVGAGALAVAIGGRAAVGLAVTMFAEVAMAVFPF